MLFLFHSSVIALNLFAIWYDQQYVDIPFLDETFVKMPFKGRCLFLTVWCLVLQTIYFTISLINDLIGTNVTAPKKPPLIRKIKDMVFSLAFTAAIYVAATFWGLYITNKELIFPDECELIVPSWLNHALHTLIVPFMLIELKFTKRNYPSRILSITLALTFCAVYVIVIHAIYYRTGSWVYPFLNMFSWPMKVMFNGCSAIVVALICILGEKLDGLTNMNLRVMFKNISVKSH